MSSFFADAEMRERNEMRALQDRIIEKCSKVGYTDNIRISENMPIDINIGAIKKYIYPAYRNELERILTILSRGVN